jgi:bacterioferritin
MHGDTGVIEQLNLALSAELTAIVQYMTQSEMCQNWGYAGLAARTRQRAIEEMHHAETLIERIIFLNGTPTVAVELKPKLGTNVLQQKFNLNDEQGAVVQYNEAARICAEAKDEGSKGLFDRMIADEEAHADYLDAQLKAIEQIGIGPYLAQQLKA